MLGFHVGTLLIFAAMVLLIIVSVSAPIWDTLAFIKVTLPGNDQTIAFGNWGYCLLRESGHQCSRRELGYDIVPILNSFVPVDFGNVSSDSLHVITRTLVLHPIAAAIAFLAWITAAGAHRIGFLFSSLIAFVAAVVTLVALVLDFVLFGVVKNHYNDADKGPGRGAKYSPAIWLVVAAFACLVLGSITVCCGCFTDRRRRARSY